MNEACNDSLCIFKQTNKIDLSNGLGSPSCHMWTAEVEQGVIAPRKGRIYGKLIIFIRKTKGPPIITLGAFLRGKKRPAFLGKNCTMTHSFDFWFNHHISIFHLKTQWQKNAFKGYFRLCLIWSFVELIAMPFSITCKRISLTVSLMCLSPVLEQDIAKPHLLKSNKILCNFCSPNLEKNEF